MLGAWAPGKKGGEGAVVWPPGQYLIWLWEFGCLSAHSKSAALVCRSKRKREFGGIFEVLFQNSDFVS